MRIIGSTSVVVVALAGAASAQLTDLQPGRNFPTALAAFGTERSESIDAGDVDNDGDLDVLVANGGDGLAQPNRLFLNQGGLQGGTQGDFVDVTATRFAGIPVDTSRDGDFADVDGDFDLDILIANRGTTTNGGEVNRAYVNLGGAQGGALGFFAEGTDGFWGDLVSIPLADQVFGGNHGPYRNYSCDCEFGDLDDDGDLDVFASDYGPNINGTRDSRLFLNDGGGEFDELWPWADAGADIKLHTMDVDLVDLDGDLDLDVFGSSRNSQARVYRNNLAGGGWAGDPFTDMTQSALIATGATATGNSNYAGEYGDLDGDGDFDVWAINYSGFSDRILRNNGDFTFSLQTTWHKGDPSIDENELDFLDYDGDGDLDALGSNFSGTNWVYQGGLAQGLTEAEGYYHRTGTTLGGSLATWPETPEISNGGTTRDGDVADLDGDGDPEILLANDGNQQNRLWLNELGVPDTHAPTFHLRTVAPDAAGPAPTVLHAQVRDNASYYEVDTYDARIVYQRDGGPETCVRMAAQGSMQFRGEIPALDGTISYRFEVTDGAGNTAVSPTESYVHSVGGEPLWQNLGCGTEGLQGEPYLQLAGTQVAGEPVTLALVDAHPFQPALLLIATSSTPLPLLGGILFTNPILQRLDLGSGEGLLVVSAPWPSLPPGTSLWWQFAVFDPSSPFGIALSNAVQSTTP